MLPPLVKYVVLTILHVLFLLLLEEDSSSLLEVPDDFPGKSLIVISTGNSLIRSLVPNDEGLPFVQDALPAIPVSTAPLSLPVPPKIVPLFGYPSLQNKPSPNCTPWLLTGMLLMDFNTHLPPMTLNLSL
ncbi:hypothetical protein DSO57_1015671 [Entomophthora muscae]|uniref:Uncharacterized protein n=1 Tax=Entomophthora muscae TaxID=34485 RepID=A0ACC2URE3_9FUNG|nr:hypothetical protein DSO57_1015671 [Entomophthora muscae]